MWMENDLSVRHPVKDRWKDKLNIIGLMKVLQRAIGHLM